MNKQSISDSIKFATDNHDKFLDDFIKLLSIPSVSTDPAYCQHIDEAADWLVNEATRIGLQNARTLPSAGMPLVYADWLHAGASKPTVLVYAHYDVQPVEPVSLWERPPFEPVVEDDKIHARGAMDDKCGCIINLKAFEAMLATEGKLPVNVKIVYEGEEESGSPNMQAAIRQYRDVLSADFVLISDGGSAPDQPLIFTSVRGIVDGEVTVNGPKQDLHSGKFGGIVHNPTHMVGKMIAALHDDDGRVQIPGFYDDVEGASSAEKAAFASIEADYRAFKQTTSGVKAFWGVPDIDFMERFITEPTCEVNGISGGYQGDGLMTIIPASASFKVSMRLVANQNPKDIDKKFRAFIRSFECDSLDISLVMHSGSFPARMMVDGPVIDALKTAYEAGWGKTPALVGSGGSVPIMGTFAQELGIPLTILGFGIGDGQHAPNEFLYLREFQRGITTAIHFYHALAQTWT